MQALFHWECNKANVEDIVSLVKKECMRKKTDLSYFRSLIESSINFIQEIDSSICNITRNLKMISLIELSIIRISVCEMIYMADTPKIVSINEAVRIAKKFSSARGYKYVNAILSRIAFNLH